MGYSAYSTSSSVENFQEEDPNIPSHVESNEIGDACTVCSDVSDMTMRQYGLEYDFKPDIGEIAIMTLDVNYGDLANMACEKRLSLRSLILDPVFSAEVDAHLTWSQLLDHEASPPLVREEQSSKLHIWTKGHEDEPSGLGDGALPLSPFPGTLQLVQSSNQFCDSVSLGSFSSFGRPRPLAAIKRLFSSQRKHPKVHDQQFSLASDVTTRSVSSTIYLH